MMKHIQTRIFGLAVITCSCGLVTKVDPEKDNTKAEIKAEKTMELGKKVAATQNADAALFRPKVEIKKFAAVDEKKYVTPEEIAAHAFTPDRDYNFIRPTEFGLDLMPNSYLLFQSNTANFASDAEYKIVAELATYLADNKNLYIRIEGHTDAEGDEQKNFELSLERAERVAAWLKTYGVDGARINLVGCGEWFPNTKTESTEQDKMLNRRVEFVFVDDSGVSNKLEPCMDGTKI